MALSNTQQLILHLYLEMKDWAGLAVISGRFFTIPAAFFFLLSVLLKVLANGPYNNNLAE